MIHTYHLNKLLFFSVRPFKDGGHVRLSVRDMIRVGMVYGMGALPREVRNYGMYVCIYNHW